MKSVILAVAAAIASSVGATHLKRHAHEMAHDEVKMRAIMGSGTSVLHPTGTPSNETCGCTTILETVTGAMSWIPNPPTPTNTSIAIAPVVAVATSSSVSVASVSTPSPVSIAPASSSTSSILVIPTSSAIASSSTTIIVSSVAAIATSSSASVIVASSSASTIAASSSASAIVASSSASASASSSSLSSSVGASGCKGITYTPYASDGSCNSYAQVLIDLTLIKTAGFNAVRTYSTDCSTLANVGGVAEILGLKIIMGIYIDNTGVTGNAASQVTAIAEWAKWDLIDMFVVGNEAVFNSFCTASELVSFIQSTKSTFEAAGYTGTYTTAEPLNIVYELVATGGFCDSIDYVGGNYHPFFNDEVTADGAGAFVSAQITIADGLCPGKSGINLETGWPSAGTCNGAACPSVANQKTAVASIVASAGANSVMFSFQNDLWKAIGEFDCEQSWGLISLF